MADRYWRGGTGTWNTTNTTNWSTTNGGGGGASVPTSADNVFFTSLSGGGTCTVGATVSCLSINMTGYTGTFAGTSTLNVFDDVTLSASGSFTYTGTIILSGTLSATIITNGKTMGGIIDTNKTAGTITLGSAVTCGQFFCSRPLQINQFTLTTQRFQYTGTSLTWGTTPGKIVVSRSTTGTGATISGSGISDAGYLEVLSPPSGTTTSIFGNSSGPNINEHINCRLISSGTGTIDTSGMMALNFEVGAGNYGINGGRVWRSFTLDPSFTGSTGTGGVVLYAQDTTGVTFNPRGRSFGGSLFIWSINAPAVASTATINQSATFASDFYWYAGSVSLGGGVTLTALKMSLDLAAQPLANCTFTFGTGSKIVLTQNLASTHQIFNMPQTSISKLLSTGFTNNTPIEIPTPVSGGTMEVQIGNGLDGTRKNRFGFKTYVSGSGGTIRFQHPFTGANDPISMHDLILTEGTYTVSRQYASYIHVDGDYDGGGSGGVTNITNFLNQLYLTGNSGTQFVKGGSSVISSRIALVFNNSLSSPAKLNGNLYISNLYLGDATTGTSGQGYLDVDTFTCFATDVGIPSGVTGAVNLTFNGGKIRLGSDLTSNTTLISIPTASSIGTITGTSLLEIEPFGTFAQGYGRAFQSPAIASASSFLNIRIVNNGSTGKVVSTGCPGSLTLENGGFTLAPDFFNNTGALSIPGSFTVLGTSPLYASGLTLAFISSAITSTISTVGSPTISPTISINTTGKTVVFGNAVTTQAITLSAGTLDMGGYTITLAGTFQTSTTSTKVIAMGSTGAFTVGQGITFSTSTRTGLSITGTSRQINAVVGSSAPSLSFGTASEAFAFDITPVIVGSGGTLSLGGFVRNLTVPAGTYTLNRDSSYTIYGNLTVNGAISGYTGGGTTLTFAGTAAIKEISTNNNTFGGVGAITFDAAGTIFRLQSNSVFAGASTLSNGTILLNDYRLTVPSFASSNSNTRTINFSNFGAIRLTGTGTVWNTSTNTNLSLGGVNRYVEPNLNGSQTLSFGTPAEASTFDVSVPSTASNNTLSFTAGNNVRNLSFANVAHTVSNIAINVYGDLSILGTNPTFSAGTNTWTFAATSGTKVITTNGETLDFPITFNGVGGTWQLGSALTMGANRAMTLTNGTFTANNFNVTLGSFVSNNSNVRTLNLGNGTWTISNSGTVWDITTATNMTLNRGTGSIVFNSGTAKTAALGGFTYPTITQGGAGTLTFSGTNSRFANLTRTVASATTITFTSGQTFLFDDFTLTGVSAAARTAINSTSTSQHTLSKSSGIVSSDFLQLSYSNATGGAGWYAGTGSLQGTSVTGWIFTAPPSNSGNMFMLF